MLVKKLSSNKNGFSLIEVLFVIVILAISIMALYSLFNLALRMVWENKARIGATQLANEKLEIFRNLKYNDVGTVGGVVDGVVPENEVVVRNSINYDVYTNVIYIDDEFDGTWETNPVDTLTSDYKRILVRVSWQSNFSTSPVEFYTDIAPKGIETTLGGGTLVLKVFDINGLPVDNTTIRVYNDTLSPIVDNTFSGVSGILILPGVKAAIESYEITVSRAAYSGDQTYDTTVALPTPDKPHLTVFEGQTTSASFLIDPLADMSIHVRDINEVYLGDLTLHIRGDRRIGLDGDGQPVYKFDEDRISNSGGMIDINNIEWDNYEITIDAAGGYDIHELNPPNLVQVLPTDHAAIYADLESTAPYSLIVIVQNVEAVPVVGASVQVTNISGYDNTILTGSAGQAFFTPLDNVATTVDVSKAGYDNYLNDILLQGYTYEPVTMTIP
jgi:prepilin-type N-terminal cleavage/methylation domain-containing protein